MIDRTQFFGRKTRSSNMILQAIVLFSTLVAAGSASGLLHAPALVSTGSSYSTRHQDGLGNYAFRYDVATDDAKTSHSEVGTAGSVVAPVPTVVYGDFHAAPALLSQHNNPGYIHGKAILPTYSAPDVPVQYSLSHYDAPAIVPDSYLLSNYGGHQVNIAPSISKYNGIFPASALVTGPSLLSKYNVPDITTGPSLLSKYIYPTTIHAPSLLANYKVPTVPTPLLLSKYTVPGTLPASTLVTGPSLLSKQYYGPTVVPASVVAAPSLLSKYKTGAFGSNLLLGAGVPAYGYGHGLTGKFIY